MKKILIILLLLLASCNTGKHITQVPVETRIEIRERLVPVPMPQDSLLLKAYLECDSTNKVILKGISESKTSGLQSSFNFNDGTLQYKAKTPRDTIYLTMRDTSINKDVPVKVTEYIEVNKLNIWQTIQIWAGRILFFFLIGFILIKIPRPK